MIFKNKINKTKEMRKYEEETRKKAVWRGNITKSFKKWQKGEKIYDKNKERIGILVSEETKLKWQAFMNENNVSTISKLIRAGVNFYINSKPLISYLTDTSMFSHDLKEPLTSIKGFSQLIINNSSDKLTPDILSKIKDIYSQCEFLETKINEIINEMKPITYQIECDVLIIEDDKPTIKVLKEFFELRGFKCKSVLNGTKGLNELYRISPKIILLDIILPDIDGFEICKKIKSNIKFKNIPVFYITAIPEFKVISKLKETNADGFLLKPFNFSEFEFLFDYL